MEPDAAVESPISSSETGTQQNPVEHVDAPVVEKFGGKERREWLDNPADFPEKQAKKAGESQTPGEKGTEKAESSTAQSAGERPEASEKEPASVPGEKTQEPKVPVMSEHEKRIKALVSEKKVLETRLAQLEKPPQLKAEEKAPEKPDPEKFETMGEYFEALAKHEADLAVAADRKSRAEEQARSASEARLKEAADKWTARVTESRKKHADFDTVALTEDLDVVEGSTLDYWVAESDLGAEVLYYYGQHRDELVALNAMRPIAAAREIARIESGLSSETGKPAQAKVTQAPPPHSEVGSKGKSTDDVTDALVRGDAGAYIRSANARERASSRK